MNANSTAKFAALAIGAYLIVEAAIGASYQITEADEVSAYSVATAVPSVLIAIFLAWILWRYTSKVVTESRDPTSVNFLRLGLKILGAYLLVTAIPALIGISVGGAFAMTYAESEVPGFVAAGITALVKTIFGFILIFKTVHIAEKMDGI